MARPGGNFKRRRRVEVIIPVRNVWWIGILSGYYTAHGVEPVWIVDRTSHPLFLLVARFTCRRRIMVRPKARRAETMLEPVVPRLECDWVVRFDGDELPSERLLERLAEIEAGKEPALDCLALVRHWTRHSSDRGFEYSRCALFGPDGIDFQYRAFRRSTLCIDESIHTPGFRVDKDRTEYCSPDMALWHFNWICYSRTERARKITIYDQQAPNAGSYFRAVYLPEEAAEGTHSWETAIDPVVLAVLLRIARYRKSPWGRILARLGPPLI